VYKEEDQETLNLQHLKANLLLLPQLRVTGTSRNPRLDAEYTTWKLENKKKLRIPTLWCQVLF